MFAFLQKGVVRTLYYFLYSDTGPGYLRLLQAWRDAPDSCRLAASRTLRWRGRDACPPFWKVEGGRPECRTSDGKVLARSLNSRSRMLLPCLSEPPLVLWDSGIEVSGLDGGGLLMGRKHSPMDHFQAFGVASLHC